MTTPAGAREEHLVASADDAGSRLDVFLARRLPDLSRSQIQRLIRSGLVAANGRAAKAGAAVVEGLAISVVRPGPVPAGPSAEPLPLTIVYDNADLIVVDKPAGMVVHPSAGHDRGTLVNALLHHVRGLSGIGGQERPGIVHRLDKGTSGVLVIAKTDAAHRDLSRQFHDRTVAKEYIALVWGTLRQGYRIDRPIGRDPRNRRKVSSRARRARPAATTVTEVEPLGGVALVHVRIHTGRTHQIRVHLSESGHPIVGDALYGGVRRRLPARLAALGRLARPFLHAARLEFDHPRDRRRLSFEAPLPDDLAAMLSLLRRVRNAGRGPGTTRP
jgi:23S rRNA pseudouridine1911/1915/1917 synthase